MVATCVATSRSRDSGAPNCRSFALGHLAGGTLGGITVGAVLGVLALASSELKGSRPFVVAAATIFAGLILLDVVGVRWPALRRHLSRRRQVPQTWGIRLRPRVLGFAYGSMLGTGIGTPTPIMAPQLLLVLGFLSGSFAACVVAWSLYGFARSVAPVVLARGPARLPQVHGVVDRSFRMVRIASFLVGIVAWAVVVGN
jgi:hypothetical protein